MVYGKVCCDRLVMSATGSSVESGETAVCLPFLDPDMFVPSNTGIPGRKRVSRRRHNMSDSIIQTHQVSTSSQETSQNRHDTETHCLKKFPFLCGLTGIGYHPCDSLSGWLWPGQAISTHPVTWHCNLSLWHHIYWNNTSSILEIKRSLHKTYWVWTQIIFIISHLTCCPQYLNAGKQKKKEKKTV